MTDPQPLIDDDIDKALSWLRNQRRYYSEYPAVAAMYDLSIATVEQVRRERDAAEAPSVELVQALLETENVVDRLTAERDAAYAALWDANDAFNECTGDYAKELVAGEPWRSFQRPGEVDAIRRARADTAAESAEPDET